MMVTSVESGSKNQELFCFLIVLFVFKLFLFVLISSVVVHLTHTISFAFVSFASFWFRNLVIRLCHFCL